MNAIATKMAYALKIINPFTLPITYFFGIKANGKIINVKPNIQKISLVSNSLLFNAIGWIIAVIPRTEVILNIFHDNH